MYFLPFPRPLLFPVDFFFLPTYRHISNNLMVKCTSNSAEWRILSKIAKFLYIALRNYWIINKYWSEFKSSNDILDVIISQPPVPDFFFRALTITGWARCLGLSHEANVSKESVDDRNRIELPVCLSFFAFSAFNYEIIK